MGFCNGLAAIWRVGWRGRRPEPGVPVRRQLEESRQRQKRGLDSVDRELGTCVIKRALGIELEGLVKRCNLEGEKRPSFSCFCVKSQVERAPLAKAENRSRGRFRSLLGLVDPGDVQRTDTCVGLELRGDCWVSPAFRGH